MMVWMEIHILMIKQYDFVSKGKLVPNRNQSAKPHQLIFFIDFARQWFRKVPQVNEDRICEDRTRSPLGIIELQGMREYEFDENACIILEWREQFFWDTPYKVLSSERQERKLGIRGGTGGKKDREKGRTRRKSIWKTQVTLLTTKIDTFLLFVACLLFAY